MYRNIIERKKYKILYLNKFTEIWNNSTFKNSIWQTDYTATDHTVPY
jgi:hypothetical protein